MPTVDLSERDNKETLFVKEEVTNDAEVFGEVVVDVEGSQKGSSSSVLLFFIFLCLLPSYHQDAIPSVWGAYVTAASRVI